MTKIQIKSAPRKTTVSRAKIRSIMSRFFGKKTPVVKKKIVSKVSSSKPV
jgi:hypothetical protein